MQGGRTVDLRSSSPPRTFDPVVSQSKNRTEFLSQVDAELIRVERNACQGVDTGRLDTQTRQDGVYTPYALLGA